MFIDPTRSGRVPLRGTERHPDPHAARVANADPLAPLAVTVRLRPDQPIPDTYTPQSRDAFEAQHGARADDVAAVDRFAQHYGLHVDRVNVAERTMSLSGSVDAMRNAFGADLATYRSADAVFVGRTGAMSVPADLAPAITSVVGLDDHTTFDSHAIVAAATPAVPGYTPLDVAKAYHFPAGDGSGEHIGVISLGGRYDDAVQATYQKAMGVPHVPFHEVDVDGGATLPHDPGPTGENMLDTEMIGTLAPNADKTIYIAPNTDRGFLDAVSRALHDEHHNSAISISWGGPEERYTPQAVRAFNEVFAEARAMGVNVFTASGDNGATDGIDDGKTHTDFPSSSPSVISTGGTKLTLDAAGEIKRETVWNELRTHQGATGGGISAENPVPAVQRDLGLGGRGVPDIAGNADPTTGFRMAVPGAKAGSAQGVIVGGTSAVAPMYAALAARLEQNLGHPIGDAQRAIYAAPATDFHDVKTGNNGGFTAGPGWDATTGRGSVDGTKLLGFLEQDGSTTHEA